MSNLFWCHTPYHIILAKALINQLQLSRWHVVLVDEDSLCQTLNVSEFFGKRNVSILTLSKSRLRLINALRFKALIRKAESILQEIGFIDRLFVFNDSRPETQYVLDTCRDSEYIAVEDGFEAYVDCDSTVWNRNCATRFLARAVYGKFISQKRYYGEYRVPQGYFLTMPDKARPSIDTKIRRTVRVDCLRSAAVVLWEYINGDTIRMSNFKQLIMLPHSKSLHDDEYLLDKLLIEATHNSVLKIHPRESCERVLAMADDWPGLVLPKAIPAEALIAKNKRGRFELLGGVSTSLITSKLLAPERTYRLIGRHKPARVQTCLKIDPNLKYAQKEVSHLF